MSVPYASEELRKRLDTMERDVCVADEPAESWTPWICLLMCRTLVAILRELERR